jgi:hypothetical protein
VRQVRVLASNPFFFYIIGPLPPTVFGANELIQLLARNLLSRSPITPSRPPFRQLSSEQTSSFSFRQGTIRKPLFVSQSRLISLVSSRLVSQLKYRSKLSSRIRSLEVSPSHRKYRTSSIHPNAYLPLSTLSTLGTSFTAVAVPSTKFPRPSNVHRSLVHPPELLQVVPPSLSSTFVLAAASSSEEFLGLSPCLVNIFNGLTICSPFIFFFRSHSTIFFLTASCARVFRSLVCSLVFL